MQMFVFTGLNHQPFWYFSTANVYCLLGTYLLHIRHSTERVYSVVFSEQTWDVDPMLGWRWASVADVDQR